MSQITRIFDSSKNANEAADELKASRFTDVRVAANPAGNGSRGGDAVAALTSAGFSEAEAEAYAGSLSPGGAVLSVETPFGRGKLAEQILDRHGPSQKMSAVTAKASSSAGRTRSFGDAPDAQAAPLSTLLHLPVLTDPKPTTVTSLGDQRPFFPTGLLRSDFYISRLFGLPLLTGARTWASLIHDPAPLSTWLGLPVLLRNSRRDHADQQPSATEQPNVEFSDDRDTIEPRAGFAR